MALVALPSTILITNDAYGHDVTLLDESATSCPSKPCQKHCGDRRGEAGDVSDKKLRSIRIRSSVGHRQNAGTIMLAQDEFILNLNLVRLSRDIRPGS